MTDITFYKLDAAFASLQRFDHCAKPDDFIEVCLWHNGEGFDAHLSSHSDQSGSCSMARRMVSVLMPMPNLLRSV